MLRVLGHRVLVRPDPIESTSKGGIVMVSDEKLERHNINRGVVISYGEKAFKAFSKDYDGEPWVQPGDYVVFARFAGRMIEDPITGEEFQVMNDEDLITIIAQGENPDYERPSDIELEGKGIEETRYE